MAAENKKGGVSDEAVFARTGKHWEEWFQILDSINAASLPHKEIAEYINTAYNIDAWYSQTITVAYERERGLRKVHEKPGGFEINVSKTINIPNEALFKFWDSDEIHKKWLPKNSLTKRKSTENKSMRMGWNEDATLLSINFYPKGDNKSQVVVQHTKLKSQKDADNKKKFWGEKLNELKNILEA